MKEKGQFFKILLYVIIIIINIILIIAVGSSIKDVIESGEIEENNRSEVEYEEYDDMEDFEY